MIFVDSPVNVGFSYSDDPRDRVFDEATVADDLLDFMQQFLKGRRTTIPTAAMLLEAVQLIAAHCKIWSPRMWRRVWLRVV